MFAREASPGQRQQLRYEISAVENLQINWEVKLFSMIPGDDVFDRDIPQIYQSLLGMRFYMWVWLLKSARQYDFVLMRHMTFDPFAILFGWFVPNRVTIHHSIEVYELKRIRRGWKGQLASAIERTFGYVSVNQVKALMGVTHEIRDYQLTRRLRPCPHFVMPNGIDPATYDLLEDNRHAEMIHIAFVASNFSSWHGLEHLLETLDETPVSDIKLHLIGRLRNDHEAQISKSTHLLSITQTYERLDKQQLRQILSYCDIGLSSFSLALKGLHEASTLKVREYLCGGLAVYAGHKDSALPDDFSYYRIGEIVIKEMIAFARAMKNISRQQIRDKSLAYVDKNIIIEDIYKKLKHLT